MKALVAGALALAALLAPRPARACDCATPEPEAKAARAGLASALEKAGETDTLKKGR